MNGPLILTVFIGLMVVWAVILCVLAVKNRQAGPVMALRVVAAIVCQMAVVFCVYGFASSFEPGVRVSWRVGYGLLVLIFVVSRP